ncbi:MAG: nicotinate (nicotinamide) nucleotide adenylyltransferase [Rhodothermaceae bacterium]|nr:nicotinate (nicotinamide) nucleotide adenylyltransferase [Rhodothermaceae bacterium]MXX59957.1 nicotinate (nicotinamide) nucleotide adenylyltransferase [Rhodothermaceae bacterium]MYD19662.1 nicotinate (nicotinamide) nucleotide adenylyltransferase [Rhodothermaceae bacterium]MYD57162.1 nicotinate (nicotinamide) nucleotide adenylyltransferase [Rhodothermaceae bacterium]MYI43207.1 nicotinate (nicotinamide) nucleotide adenylyltransferase [Rhodothermaceae bacterium]
MNVGIFGGSFDPPHCAHLRIAEFARSNFGLELILWVPAYDPPHKSQKQLSQYQDRLGMVRAAIADYGHYRVSDIESTIERPTYTIRMLDALRERYPDADFYLILGSDSLKQFHTWMRPDVIARRVQILVYPRAGYLVGETDLPEYLRGRVQFMEAPEIAISAEHIRSRFSGGQPVRHLVSDDVHSYIAKHRLYGGYNNCKESDT